MEEALDTTTPFMTIDPMVSYRLLPVYSALNGGDWKILIQSDDELRLRLVSQGVANPEERSSMTWDDANLFFLSCVDLTTNGRPYPLFAGISKERFGRFPYGDGSAMTYLREWIRDSNKDTDSLEEMSELLEMLETRMSGTSMEKGIGKLEMRGWLTNEETTSLRKFLSTAIWTPAADEPLDGGCQDAAKNIVALLRSAEKRKCGVLLRVHN
ncbi:MAG: hypothetical protein HOE76_02540 [Euryarchaeota archaeon]|jgi:hypothetical protein|nr:hypothetical protein [Euryarchaeota archaeon]MBT4981839.1 hypothetical protein [Euryarchaeota archaeon]